MIGKYSDELNAFLEKGVGVQGRRIMLHGDVEEAAVSIAINGMYALADQGKDPITLFVKSYGGDLDEAFALHDVTRTICVPVHTVALGKCQSAAPLLVACGHKGERWATANCVFMLHDMSLEAPEGSPANVQAWADVAKLQMKNMAQHLGKYTKKPTAYWKRMIESKIDRFFSAEDALEWGMIDGIWDEKG